MDKHDITTLKHSSTKQVKIQQIDSKTGEIITIFNSLADLTKILNIPKSTIRYKMLKVKPINGYIYKSMN